MVTKDFDYDLPERLIAQVPGDRGESNLLVLHRSSGRLEFRRFPDLLEYLLPGDTLVLNDTRVTARRLIGLRESGRDAEALLLRPEGDRSWVALVRPGKSLKPGATIIFPGRNGISVEAKVVSCAADGARLLEFADSAARDSLLNEGVAPLPPYIRTALADESRYQTVYAGPGGSAAAPTAGLHFTTALLNAASERGVGIARVTLHVGVDTFRPVKTDSLDDHVMHGEWYSLSQQAADQINATTGRIVAVGTTAVRVLESAAVGPRTVRAGEEETRLFIKPGYDFRVVDRLLTNFHLPKSTLVMLVSAFAGRDQVLAAYRAAIAREYRFFSFGDAMLIL